VATIRQRESGSDRIGAPCARPDQKHLGPDVDFNSFMQDYVYGSLANWDQLLVQLLTVISQQCFESKSIYWDLPLDWRFSSNIDGLFLSNAQRTHFSGTPDLPTEFDAGTERVRPRIGYI
jgi:hypothetical protein